MDIVAHPALKLYRSHLGVYGMAYHRTYDFLDVVPTLRGKVTPDVLLVPQETEHPAICYLRYDGIVMGARFLDAAALAVHYESTLERLYPRWHIFGYLIRAERYLYCGAVWKSEVQKKAELVQGVVAMFLRTNDVTTLPPHIAAEINEEIEKQRPPLFLRLN